MKLLNLPYKITIAEQIAHCLKSLLATQLTIQNDDRADFREIVPDLMESLSVARQRAEEEKLEALSGVCPKLSVCGVCLCVCVCVCVCVSVQNPIHSPSHTSTCFYTYSYTHSNAHHYI